MEANRIGALLSGVEQGGSQNQRVHFDTAFSRTNSFDDLLQTNDLEFDAFNLPVLPSPRLSPLPAVSVEINEVVAMASQEVPPEKLAKRARVNTWKAKRIQADNISEELAIYEMQRNVIAMAARNNERRKQLEAKQRQLQHHLARNEALKKEIEYYKKKIRQDAAEMANDPDYADMADDPDYAELMSKLILQLALLEFSNPRSQH